MTRPWEPGEISESNKRGRQDEREKNRGRREERARANSGTFVSRRAKSASSFNQTALIDRREFSSLESGSIRSDERGPHDREKLSAHTDTQTHRHTDTRTRTRARGTHFEFVYLALEPSDLLVPLLEAPLQLERLRLVEFQARLAFLQLVLQLGHQIAQIVVVVRHGSAVSRRARRLVVRVNAAGQRAPGGVRRARGAGGRFLLVR